MSEKVFIIGCGNIGGRVAFLLKEYGTYVAALARSAEKAEELQKLGIEPMRGDLNDPLTLEGLPITGKTVFYFAPPPGGGVTDPRMRAFCNSIHLGNEPRKVVYISTSAVYGDCGDAPVTEETPTNPQTARGKRRLDAETTLLSWGAQRKVPVVVLRVTGIYGPGRLPISQLAGGHPVINENEAPITNRIHAHDLARICIAAAEKGENGDIFNVSDGRPTTMTHYFNAVADALGLPRPPQVGMAEASGVMSPLMLSYISESRRMDNSKMLKKLGLALLYPDLDAGLKAILAETDQIIQKVS